MPTFSHPFSYDAMLSDVFSTSRFGTGMRHSARLPKAGCPPDVMKCYRFCGGDVLLTRDGRSDSMGGLFYEWAQDKHGPLEVGSWRSRSRLNWLMAYT